MPKKSDINPQTGLPYAVNPATGQWDDNYWANVVEPKLKATNGISSDNVIQTAIDSFTKQIGDYNNKLTQYDKANPFAFDQVLATERGKATQQLDPYYSQTLNDLITGINTQRTRSQEDTNTLLSELNADTSAYTGQAKIDLNNALEKSANGYAGAGLYSSGAAQRSQGQTIQQSNADVANYNRGITSQQNRAITGNTRNLQDLALQEKQKTRDINQEKSYNVESTALSNARNAQLQNEFERQQFAGAAPGVNPISYSNTLYSILGA